MRFPKAICAVATVHERVGGVGVFPVLKGFHENDRNAVPNAMSEVFLSVQDTFLKAVLKS